MRQRRSQNDEKRIEGINGERKRKWFLKSRNSDKVRVNKKLRDLITFKPLNLMGDWPMQGQFDILFCRNVVIYFNKETQRILFDRYAKILKDDGYMFIGQLSICRAF